MRSKFMTLLTVIGAVTVLALAANTVALAATGQSLLLGKSNTSGAITALTRTSQGTALKLQTAKAFNAPLAVNGTGKVANLNADKVDGLDSSQMVNQSYVWTKAVTVPDNGVTFTIPIPKGTWVVGYSIYMSGGGATGGESGCFLRRQAEVQSFFAEDRSATVLDQSPGHSGSALITISEGVVLALSCTASAEFTTLATQPIQVYATRTSTIGGGVLKQAAHAQRVDR